MEDKEKHRSASDAGKETDAGAISAEFMASARPIVTVDVQKYQSWLDDSDLTDEQKEEFLQSLWSIVVAFVELGFGVHPLQEVCGQDSALADQSPKDAFNRVSSSELNETRKGLSFAPSGEPEVK